MPVEPAMLQQTESRPQPPPLPSGDVIDPANIEYLSAFRLPDGDEHPQTFAYAVIDIEQISVFESA